MNKFEIALPANLNENDVIAEFKRAIKNESLFLKSESTLKTIPGCIHWHITKPNHNGTLEATFDKNRLSLFLSYHNNRYAEWIISAIENIKRALESKSL